MSDSATQSRELPTTEAGLAKEVATRREKLRELQLAHALQKLDSPTTLRTARRNLARALTAQSARQPQAAKPRQSL
jgi:ribosomal protein L29